MQGEEVVNLGVTVDLSSGPIRPFGATFYELDDPTAESIYQHYIINGLSDEQITHELLKPIVWKIDNQGKVNLTLPIDEFNTLGIGVSYYPDQLPNLFALYGALYSFYDQVINEETINRLNARHIISAMWQNMGRKFYDVIKSDSSYVTFSGISPRFANNNYVIFTTSHG